MFILWNHFTINILDMIYRYASIYSEWNKYSKFITVIYNTIDLKHKFHKKINNLQTLKLSKLVPIVHYICYNYLSNDFDLS
jgi:hypothetical protein